MKSHLTRSSILSLFLLFFQYSFSQQYFIKTYTVKDGLPTRNVNSACQDRDGIMWFATNYGVSRYDGFSFTNYNFNSGLPDQQYKSIKVDEKGILWVMPESYNDTIVYFKSNTWNKIPPLKSDASKYRMNSFDVIYKNDKPVIGMGSYNGFNIYENGKWTHFNISAESIKNYVYTVVAKQNKFYLATKTGICVFDKGKPDVTLNALIKPFGSDIICISFENKNKTDEKLWILNEKWIGYIQHNSFTMVSDKFELPHPTIYYNAFLNTDAKGNVFFGNIWAKYYISATSNIPVPLMVHNGFTSDGATSAFTDSEQNIWFTDTRGISKLNNLKLKTFFEKNGMRENEVSAVTEMNDGRIVLGHNKGLSILNADNTFKTIAFSDPEQKNKRVLDITRDNSGNIWFVSIGLGLGKLTLNGIIKWYNPNNHGYTTAVGHDNNGRIWVGSNGKLFYVQNDQLVEYSLFKETYNSIRRLFADGKSGIYVAGTNGLWHIHDGLVEKVPSPTDKKAENVFSYLKDKNGVEFVGTRKGLYVIEKGRIIKFQKEGIEINNPVFFMFQDRSGKYWIGSDNGVYKWDGKSKIDVYNTYNGLAGWETNRAAGMQDSKGRIWVGTDQGLSCFETGFDKTIIPTPVIRLLYTEDSKGVQHQLTKESSIQYANNTLIFHFRGISFFNEELIEYKYKLEGFDQEWQDINQNLLGKVKYIGLKPGSYSFSVMAKNFSGSWSEVSRSELIRITQPVYFRWWFLLLAFAVSGGIIYGVIRINIQRIHNSRLEKEIIERKRFEQALTESRQKYQDLVKLLPETIYEADYSGKLIYLNDTGLKLFGYKHADVETDFHMDQLITSESPDDIRFHMEAVFKYKKSDRAIMTGISKQGKTFPLSIHSVPIIFQDRCIGIRGIIIDLTDQKRFEEQLQKNAADLQALNNSKDKFFSIIAHDLRSPFTTFLGFTEILDEELNTLPKEELQSIVTLMRNSAMNLYQLLENLLEWSLLHREITKFEPKTLPLLPLVQNCTSIIADGAKLKGIDLHIEIPENITVVADIHMLQTIIRNLLSNAVKFTSRDGSVLISASAKEEHFITLSVKDTGIGIKPEMIEKIFLFDTNNKTKGTDGELSTGLGLILCKEFVEKHGGKIWVESEEGKGSTFYFTVGSS